MKSAAGSSVVVVGGGIIGLACAHYLVNSGHHVTIIDQSQIGKACSHGNCGMISPSHVLPLTEPGAVWEGFKSLFNPSAVFRFKPQLRLSLYRWMLQFARRCNKHQMHAAAARLLPILESSMAEYRALFNGGLLTGEWKDNGLLYAFRTQKALQKFARKNAVLSEKYGVSARLVNGEELPDFEPALKAQLAGAYFYDRDGSARPDRLISDWRQRLSAAGVVMLEGCRLQGVHRQGNTIHSIQTSQGELTADHYVFAAGAWSALLGQWLGCYIPVEPGKGYSLTMEKTADMPQHPLVFLEQEVAVTPFNDSYRIGSLMEFAGFDTSIPQARITQLRDSARLYLRTSIDNTVGESWYGWRPMTWDSLPIIGRVPDVQNAILATGHNMLGLTLAPATGRLVTELIDEVSPHIDIQPYSPSRF